MKFGRFRLLRVIGMLATAGAVSASGGEQAQSIINYRATGATLPRIGTVTHPHLYCDRADIQKVSARIREGRPRALWNRLLSNCRSYMDPSSAHFIDVSGGERDFAVERGDYFIALRSSAELAFAALAGGPREYGRRAAQILNALVTPPTRDKTFMGNPNALSDWRTNPRGSAVLGMPAVLGVWAMAYDLAAPFMTAAEKKAAADFLLNDIKFLWSRRWLAPVARNNINQAQNYGPAAAALSLWGDSEDPILAAYPEYAAPNVEDWIESSFNSDGSCFEGVGYGLAMKDVLALGLAMNRKGIKHGLLDPRPAFRNIPLFWYLTREPEGLPWAYSKMMDPTQYPLVPNPMFLFIAKEFHVPVSLWFWRQRFDALSSGSDMAPANYETSDWDWRPEVLFNLLWCDDEDKAESPEEAGIPASYEFKKLGLVVARKDHREETPVFRLLAGPHYDHKWDAMSISMSAYGQRLIVDPGFYYVKMKGEPGADLLFTTAAHSAPLLNGEGPETLSKTGWPALIEWHWKDRDLEYVMASAAFDNQGIVTDGYGNLKFAERHALVVHEGETPFYAVTCDMFDYPEKLAATKPALDFVLVAAENTKLSTDAHGATIVGSKASLRAELVTNQGVTMRLEPLQEVRLKYQRGERTIEGQGAHNPRLIWSRKGEHGRILTVLTPLRQGMEAPKVELLEDAPERTTCSVRFGGHEDRITFWSPRPEVSGPDGVRTGRRILVERRSSGATTQSFSFPSPSDGYVIP